MLGAAAAAAARGEVAAGGDCDLATLMRWMAGVVVLGTLKGLVVAGDGAPMLEALLLEVWTRLTAVGASLGGEVIVLEVSGRGVVLKGDGGGTAGVAATQQQQRWGQRAWTQRV